MNKYSLYPSIRFLRLFLIPVLLSTIIGIPLQAEETNEVPIRILSGDIEVDGILDEPAWQEEPSIDNLTQVEPYSGEEPTEKTKVWLAYTKDALYIAVQCHDGNPGKIVATAMKRDAMLMENDNIEIVLDTYHDHRNAYFFSTNPAGAIVDGRISENQFASLEWDGIWNVRTRIDNKGWSAEFEIPFKTIGFNPNISEWGFNISRYLARNREGSRWVSPSLDVQMHHVVRAGQITGMKDISQGVGLDIKTYGITGFTRDIYQPDLWKAEYDGGVDIFYRITSNLVSSTTINTDFAETEVDARQVNLTRFPLFFPEKRSFFLEDAGTFEFAKSEPMGPPDMNMGGDLIPFFSRRIGLVNKTEAPLRVGQKLTGKIGRFDIGLLDVQTGRLDASENPDGYAVASKNLSVGRVKANFLSQSYVGAMFTNGDPTGLTGNQMAGLDFKLATSNFMNRKKNLSLVLFGSRTETTGLDNRNNAYGGTITYPNDLVEFEYKWIHIGENYNPALGFVPRTGVRISSVTAEVSPRPEAWGIRQLAFEVSYNDYFNIAHQSWESKELRINPVRLDLNSGDMIGYDYTRNEEQLFEPWTISFRNDVTLPTGTYTFDAHKFFFFTSERRPFSFHADFGTGSFYSGTRYEFGGEVAWRKNRHLTTSFSWEQNWIRLPEGDFNTSLVIYRLDYSFTPFITLANFVQYDTESADIGLQSRLRWIFTPGREIFIVLNHNWQENELDRFESAQTRFRVKLNYAFRF
ncbi:MAG: carbohydrate binding family 9 domain-containing protein [Acidobacteria bacterium]|nr:carbohydrate binding family 9 domain-containing protein [Acidobacteriota bacterium]